jgi:ABC-type Fe3+/spermidine/putrescine transport system ATPase subunit
MLLKLKNIEKSFDEQPILMGVSLEVNAGEIVALLGPSGCGKTTLLRIISGLEDADRGDLLFKGEGLSGIPVHERGFGLVFQDYALFPHKNVAGNIEFGLRMLGWDQKQRSDRVRQVLDLVGLRGFEERSIHELSGGEQQRVALARSLAPSPQLLLLDEPMGSLDRALRDRLMRELRTILKDAGGILDRPEGFTAIFVTHDQEEAFAVADRVIVMNTGLIEQIADPVSLYRNPANTFVASFLGMDNIVKGHLISDTPPTVRTKIGDLFVAPGSFTIGDGLTLLIRPEAASLSATKEIVENSFTATLMDLSFRGRYQVVTFDLITPADGAKTLKFDFDTDVSLPRPGSDVRLYLNPASIITLTE